MKATDTYMWDFETEPTDTSLIRCPDEDCLAWSPLADWRESEVPCEDCGSHAAMQCPRCDERFDHVHGKTFEVKETTQ